MAYNQSSLSSDEIAWKAADYPLIAPNVTPIAPSVARWNTAGTTTDTDRTLSTNPARRAYDGFVSTDTRTDGTAASTWYYVLDFGSGGEIEIDCAFIIGHNFGTLSLTTVTLEIADDANFSSNLLEIGDFGTPGVDTRLRDVNFNSNNRYSNVRYLRLKLSRGSNFTPELHEIILGRRRQFKVRPRNPFDPDRKVDQKQTTRTMGGESQTVIFSRGMMELDARVQLWEDDRISDIKSFYDDLNVRNQFVWVWEPGTASAQFRLMNYDNEGLSLPSADYTEREFAIRGSEQGPEEYFFGQES